MKSNSIGLIDQGSKTWIAGINYCSSILFANSLLSPLKSLNINLFLYKQNRNKGYFKNVIQHASTSHYYNHQYGTRFAGIQLFKHNIKAKLFGNKDQIIDNNLPNLLRNTNCKVIYPANGLLSNGPKDIKRISWIPDFQYKYYPEYSPNKERLEYIYRRILNLSDLIVVSNECSKQDIIKFFPKYIHKVRVMPFTMWLGREWKSDEHEKVIEKYNIRKKYLIFPSQFWAHKNHKCLLESILILKDNHKIDINLVCTGNKCDLRNSSYFEGLQLFIQENNLNGNIKILGLIPREDQIQLIRGAAAVITPSLFEGWSALVDEAQSLGKTIFVSDIPMHREQHDSKSIYFDPNNAHDLAEILHKYWPNLLSGPDLNSEKRGMDNYLLKLNNFAHQFKNICNSVI